MFAIIRELAARRLRKTIFEDEGPPKTIRQSAITLACGTILTLILYTGSLHLKYNSVVTDAGVVRETLSLAGEKLRHSEENLNRLFAITEDQHTRITVLIAEKQALMAELEQLRVHSQRLAEETEKANAELRAQCRREELD